MASIRSEHECTVEVLERHLEPLLEKAQELPELESFVGYLAEFLNEIGLTFVAIVLRSKEGKALCLGVGCSAPLRAWLVEHPGACVSTQPKGLHSVSGCVSGCAGVLGSNGVVLHSVVPLRANGQILGELHLGAHQPLVGRALPVSWLRSLGALLALVVERQCLRDRLDQERRSSVWQRQLFDALMDSQSQGVMVTREDGTVILVNQAAQLILRTSAGVLLADRLFQRFPQLVELQDAPQPGAPVVELDVPGDAGEDRRVRVSLPFWLKEAQGRSAVWLLWDVTAERRAEQEVVRAERRMREIFDGFAAAALVARPDGQLLMSNALARELLSLGDDAEGSLLGSFVEGADALLAPTPPGGQRTLLLRLSSGRNILLGFSNTRVSMPEGEAIIVICRDIAPLKAAEERRTRAEQLAQVGEMAARLAHEVKNPLASVMAGLQVLQESVPVGGEDARIIGSLLRETRRLDHVTRELLRRARPESLAPRRLWAARLVFDAVQEHTEFAASKGVVLTCREVEGSREAGLELTADPVLLERVVTNLLINAVEASPRGGRVTLGMSVLGPDAKAERFAGFPGSIVVLEVSDEGMGIPEDLRPRLFEAFFTTKPEGTGLGLTIVREAVAIHGGVLEVESPRGGGTTVRVYLPQGSMRPCWEALERGCVPVCSRCPVRLGTNGFLCWAFVGKVNFAETGDWREECRRCRVFRRSSLEPWRSGR